MNPAPNLFLIGPMGAGKSTVGRHVAERLQMPFVDLDHEIEAHTGAAISLISASGPESTARSAGPPLRGLRTRYSRPRGSTR